MTRPETISDSQPLEKETRVANNTFSKIPERDLSRLLRCEHSDPHSILGAHPDQRGVIFRTYRPDAERVVLLVEGDQPTEMRRRPEPGMFEIYREGLRDVPPYRLEVHHPGNYTVTIRSPYSFPPTLGDLDLHLWGEHRHDRIWDKLGAHIKEINGVQGAAFAVWAPNATGVGVVGNFNSWDGRLAMMRIMGSSGIWELFIPELGEGAIYKYEIHGADGSVRLKSDPFAQLMELPPATASKVVQSKYQFTDQTWIAERGRRDPLRQPMATYEMHLGSWKRVPEEGNRPLTYRELAYQLPEYLAETGFTHVEFLPLMEHPFTGSWGYETSGYYAPTARYGTPDDLRFLIDQLHRKGISVILDWVPAHFPTDAFSLGRFDGSALYEHIDPRQGFHPEWHTYIFNYARNEVRSFLLGSAQYWLKEFHADGLRVDAVSSMLYLDYGRKTGEWIPNEHGGRENLQAMSFLRELSQQIYAKNPGISMIAEESTAWPAISRPVYVGGLGFGFKWDMGWMHDTLEYFSKEPIHRRYHHGDLTFGITYAWSENFILPLSHDEVVYGKKALLDKMPGDRWQKFANLRALLGYMWARPGKKILFMGGEFGQWREWNHDASLDWHLLAESDHRGLQSLVTNLNQAYKAEPALWEADHDPAGFQWIDANNADENVIAFVRTAPSSGRQLVCICNFAPVVRHGYRIGLPKPGLYRELVNTDSALFGGSNQGNAGAVMAEAIPWHGLPYSASITLPPLATLWLEPPI
jgi:1,4-alpha-glucan branching enzyme